MITGTITKIFRNEEGRKDRGGYFFVRGADGYDRFAHANDLPQAHMFGGLEVGQAVTFEAVDPTPGTTVRGNGRRAINVVLA